MIRNSTKSPGRKLAATALLALSITGSLDPAEAEPRRKSYQSEPVVQETLPGTPVMAIASIRDQRISLYDANGNALRSKISSGQTGYETPVGIYSVLQKNKDHYSNVYDGASMHYMQRITWSGVALHQGALPGYPASHGCVRLPESYASQIFPLTRIGMRVVVAREQVAPVALSHSRLLQPAPLPATAMLSKAPYEVTSANTEGLNVFQPDLKRWSARQAEFDVLKADATAKMAAAEALKPRADEMKRVVDAKTAALNKISKPLRKAEALKKSADSELAFVEKKLAKAVKPAAIADWEKAKTKALFAFAKANTKLEEETAKVKPAKDALEAAKSAHAAAASELAGAQAVAVAAQQKTFPVSMFVSRKTQRLYVRQGHEAVVDVPVTIAEPDKPIGTYVYTAVDYLNGGNALKWTAVSLTGRQPIVTASLSDRKSRRDAPVEPMQTDAGAASAALDRITIPQEIIERFRVSAWLGSSLIVSDEEAHKETGKATDFIVLMSGEPQGGIKKRPKPKPSLRPYYGYGSGYYVTYGGVTYSGKAYGPSYYGPGYNKGYKVKPAKPSFFSLF